MSEPMRVHRALARAGVASRRKAEDLVTRGQVMVNGIVAVTGQIVDPSRDRITVDGVAIGAPARIEWIVLNKPRAVLTTKTGAGGRDTVFNLVPKIPGLTYVGRLDFMTEGVLLLTTDGAAAHALTHPSREVERSYLATVKGPAVEAARLAREGVELEDGLVIARSAEAHSLGKGWWELEITIAEGRNREIRRLCTELGLEVDRLVRTRFGPVHLGSLATGDMRPLTPPERRWIDKLTQGERTA